MYTLSFATFVTLPVALSAISEGDNSYSYGYLLNAYMTDNKVDMEIKILDVQGNRKEIKVEKRLI